RPVSRATSCVGPTVSRFLFRLTASASAHTSTLSLHDALPILNLPARANSELIEAAYQAWLDNPDSVDPTWRAFFQGFTLGHGVRSEEHTSELQSRENLVCRLLLEKKKRDGAQRRSLLRDPATP